MSGAWLAVRWLHVLAMALFVGGPLILVAAVIPALRTEHRPALRSIAPRFDWASLAALGALIATGSALRGRPATAASVSRRTSCPQARS